MIYCEILRTDLPSLVGAARMDHSELFVRVNHVSLWTPHQHFVANLQTLQMLGHLSTIRELRMDTCKSGHIIV